MITFSVDGVPVGQGVLRQSKYGYTYEASKGHKAWRAAVMAKATEAWGGAEPWLGPVGVVAIFAFPYPLKYLTTLGEPKAGAPYYKITRPDTDHLIRSIGDALVRAGCMKDDNQIAHWDALKVYGKAPSALLTIRALEE
jgi:Holliday junction resolvase RusA-like endonuclease